MASKYGLEPLGFEGMKTVPIRERGGKVRAEHLGKVYEKGSGVSGLIESLPHLLAADSFRAVVDAVCAARSKGKGIVWGLGGHVVKCGLGPVLVDLMRRGFVTAFAMNGAASIHDFEMAIAGATSEDVETVLPDGRFGSAEETGREMNEALAEGVKQGKGAGEALGERLQTIGDSAHAGASILYEAWKASVPVTVHVAVGTDTPHTHPAAEGVAIGEATHRDFRLFASVVRTIDGGGVYLNVGSAVVLPEVFLKAVSVVRNLGYPLGDFTTVNSDFLQHYRPRVNVVERPHAGAGGRGYALTGHHEILVPLLAAALIERTE